MLMFTMQIFQCPVLVRHFIDVIYFATEASYADQKKRIIIPLIVEADYPKKADGWLGLLIANRLYFDFTNKEASYDDVMTKLIAEIRKQLSRV